MRSVCHKDCDSGQVEKCQPKKRENTQSADVDALEEADMTGKEDQRGRKRRRIGDWQVQKS